MPMTAARRRLLDRLDADVRRVYGGVFEPSETLRAACGAYLAAGAAGIQRLAPPLDALLDLHADAARRYLLDLFVAAALDYPVETAGPSEGLAPAEAAVVACLGGIVGGDAAAARRALDDPALDTEPEARAALKALLRHSTRARGRRPGDSAGPGRP
jgi:hypothetical protein